jgi:hypothetical protein
MPNANSTITAANAVITISISGIFSAPQQIQGFSADNIYDVSDMIATETMMGVDGRLSGGFVYNPIQQTFTLQADSPSNNVFETWAAQQRANKDAYYASGTTLLTSIGQEYISTRGFLKSFPPIPTAAKVLQPRKYVIEWESVLAVPV